jgi:hypothetical protein
MSRNFDRRLERLERVEAAAEPEADVDLAELMRAARLRWETDPEGMERERREWVTDTEARLAAGEVLPAQTVELLEAHRRRERSRQMEAAR